MEKWYVAAKKADFDGWARKFHISPVTARILRNRDLTEEDQIQKFLYGKLEDCYSPWLLKDMDIAVDEILKAVKEGLSIRVIGDYDVDGICSSYILTKGFQMLGAQVDTAIPHRIHSCSYRKSLLQRFLQYAVPYILLSSSYLLPVPHHRHDALS